MTNSIIIRTNPVIVSTNPVQARFLHSMTGLWEIWSSVIENHTASVNTHYTVFAPAVNSCQSLGDWRGRAKTAAEGGGTWGPWVLKYYSVSLELLNE